MFHSIRWRVAFAYIALVLLAMISLSVYLSGLVRSTYLSNLETQLTNEALLVGEVAKESLTQIKRGESLDVLARHYAHLLGTRVTIVAADGTVLGESHEDRMQMDNHLYRVEVQSALATGRGASIRFSRTMGYEMLYVAVSMKHEEQVIGIVRLALPLHQIEANVTRLRLAILVATLAMTALAAFLAVLIAERIAQPLRSLTAAVRRVANGDLDTRLLLSARDEIGTLTRAFNQMADRLREMITALTEEQSRLAAILEHMADGVLITNGEGRVKLINPAAARILDTSKEMALGRSFAQVARHHQLIGLWQNCRQQGEEQVGSVEVGLHGPFLQVIVTPLQGAESQACLVILQDLTRIRRLETIRRDFISNISHELRTPLASLKALVETLSEGALQDPSMAQRFLQHMNTEVDALTQMVQELLELSRIESGQAPFRIKPTPIDDLVLPVIERLHPQAKRAGLQLVVNLSPHLPLVMADIERIHQVITNLVHNAIKFTPSGGVVTVSAEARGEEIVVCVRDTGIGIPADALPRIFERFYKVGHARASQGTGLGLAIAKHIIQGHGGRIWVESTEGQGSTFYFTLPTVREA